MLFSEMAGATAEIDGAVPVAATVFGLVDA